MSCEPKVEVSGQTRETESVFQTSVFCHLNFVHPNLSSSLRLLTREKKRARRGCIEKAPPLQLSPGVAPPRCNLVALHLHLEVAHPAHNPLDRPADQVGPRHLPFEPARVVHPVLGNWYIASAADRDGHFGRLADQQAGTACCVSCPTSIAHLQIKMIIVDLG